MNIKLDTWYEFLIVGIVIIASLFIVYLIVKLILNNGGIRMKNFNLGKNNFPCSEHTEDDIEIIELARALLNSRMQYAALQQKE